MTLPSPPTASTFLTQSIALRTELKTWEVTFAASHSGNKPTRADIKAHPEIAQKYKLYSTLRAPVSPLSSPSQKRNHVSSGVIGEEALHKTPQKRRKFEGNGKDIHAAILDPYDAPHSVQRTPIAQRTCIGPTPQKDGIVLGLFDLLSPGSASKAQNAPTKQNTAAQATPSKPRPSANGTPLRKAGTTPKSQKRSFLITPSARRAAEQCTPTSRHSISKLRFCDETPEFLRRDSQRGFTARGVDGEDWSPMKMRLPPNFAGRGLSALVKGLRDLEDEKLDEEMDVLREMENEKVGEKKKHEAKVIVKDSQLEMPLGADGEAAASEDEREILGRDGKPLKVWKKKGQKRTTRKVNMRPSAAKWKPETEWVGAEDELVVGETQVGEKLDRENGPARTVEGVREEDTGTSRDGGGKVRKAVKKIKATAHANFRALKIKNKNSKAKGRGRFGRRR